MYIHSEGIPKRVRSERSFLTRQVDAVTSEYVDESGVVRDVAWGRKLIKEAGPKANQRPSSRAGKQPKMPRVELRISQPTLQKLLKMIRSDVFIGSASGLRNNLVRTLAGGVGMYPRYGPSGETPCCCTESDVHKGSFDTKTFARYRAADTRDNEKYP